MDKNKLIQRVVDVALADPSKLEDTLRGAWPILEFVAEDLVVGALRKKVDKHGVTATDEQLKDVAEVLVGILDRGLKAKA